MKTANISLYEAYPPVCGAAVVTYNLAKFLSGKKFLLQLGSNTGEITLEKDLQLINIRTDFSSRLKKAISLFSNHKKIAAHVEKIDPRFIILEGASWSVYYWVLFRNLKRKKLNAKIIYHAHNIEYLLRKEKNNRIIAFLTKWAEGKLIKGADLVTSVSREDALQMEALYGRTSILLPNGVDIEKFESVSGSQVKEIRRKYGLHGKIVLFMGLTTYSPNEEALDFLINEVFPSVVKQWPDAKLAVIGGGLDEKRDWIINPGIIPFEEVPAFVKACDICVSPIFSGSGTRLKILEYMAAEKPVVATTKGAEGILAKTGKNILLADRGEAFIVNILRLFENPDFADDIALNGRSLVRATYGWEQIIKSFIIHLKNSLSIELT